jgi:hypothetical protein
MFSDGFYPAQFSVPTNATISLVFSYSDARIFISWLIYAFITSLPYCSMVSSGGENVSSCSEVLNVRLATSLGSAEW